MIQDHRSQGLTTIFIKFSASMSLTQPLILHCRSSLLHACSCWRTCMQWESAEWKTSVQICSDKVLFTQLKNTAKCNNFAGQLYDGDNAGMHATPLQIFSSALGSGWPTSPAQGEPSHNKFTFTLRLASAGHTIRSQKIIFLISVLVCITL